VIASLFEKRASGLYHNTAASSTRTARSSASTARCTSRTTRSTTRSSTSRRATRASGLEDKVRPDRRADLLGPVVPRGGPPDGAPGGGDHLLPDGHRLAPAREEEHGAEQHDAWETIQRSHAVANGCFVAACNRIGLEKPAGGPGIEFWGQSFVAGTGGRDPGPGAARRRRSCRPRRPGRGRRHPDALAVPAGPPDRRLRRPDEALSRLGEPCAKAPQTPAALGYRMPAEWEPQEAVWLSWPHNRETWPGNFRPIPAQVFAGSRRRSAAGRRCGSTSPAPTGSAPSRSSPGRRGHGERRILQPPDERRLVPRPRADLRPHDRTGEVAVTDWDYNAWGGKYPPFDRTTGSRSGSPAPSAFGASGRDGPRGRLDRRQRQGPPPDDGGCLLNPNRNPGSPARRSRATCATSWASHGPLARRRDRGRRHRRPRRRRDAVLQRGRDRDLRRAQPARRELSAP
jgi:hypothetical protein